MTEMKQKRAGGKTGGLVAGAILMMGLAFAWLTPCSGMDALTQSELGELSGRSGITMAFGSAITVEATFNSLSFGDTDGWGNNPARAQNPGWLVLIGDGSNTGTLSSSIPQGSILTIDVGTTGGAACAIAGPAPHAGIVIPANTPFFTFSLTKAVIGLQDPTTVNICLTNSATQAVGSMEKIGLMRSENLLIDKVDRLSTCYVWAH